MWKIIQALTYLAVLFTMIYLAFIKSEISNKDLALMILCASVYVISSRDDRS